MASIEKDSVSGQMTTGHEWDGIKELNTPLPRWWVWVFWACVIWAAAYWVAMPSWPTATGFAPGMLGYSSRGSLDEDLAAQKKMRSVNMAKIEAASLDDIAKTPDLRNFALAAGKVAFGENCSACHGMGGEGRAGLYPNLTDDVWLWGGSLEEIQQTITHGVRNEDSQSRQSQMLPFGTGDALTDDQVGQVADYVVALASKAGAGLPGEAIFAERCVACHGEGGIGNKDMGAPPLNTAIRTFHKAGKDGVVDQIKAPKHGSMPSWASRLDAATIKMLAVFVQSRGPAQK